jgi:hypothetical protein
VHKSHHHFTRAIGANSSSQTVLAAEKSRCMQTFGHSNRKETTVDSQSTLRKIASNPKEAAEIACSRW